MTFPAKRLQNNQESVLYFDWSKRYHKQSILKKLIYRTLQ